MHRLVLQHAQEQEEKAHHRGKLLDLLRLRGGTRLPEIVGRVVEWAQPPGCTTSIRDLHIVRFARICTLPQLKFSPSLKLAPTPVGR